MPQVLRPDCLTPAMLGALAAIVAAAVRRAGVPVVVALVNPTSALDPASDDVYVARLSASAFDETTHLRALLPSTLISNPGPSFDRSRLRALGDLPIGLPIIACRTIAAAAELAALGVGDAWMFGSAWGLGSLDAPLRGAVWLCSGPGERALCAESRSRRADCATGRHRGA